MDTPTENYGKQLEHLLALLNDGKAGYRSAADQTGNPELKAIFLKYVKQRERLADDLKKQMVHYGGDPGNAQGGPLGALHRGWLTLKTALTSNDDQAILETCKNGDQAALDAYDEALQGSILETSLKPVLMNQRIDIHQALLEIDRLYFSLFKSSPEL